MVFVTHSIEEAIIVSSRIVVLSPHPGRVRAEINSIPFDNASRDGDSFLALHQRIHNLLFGEAASSREGHHE
jgi:NitT/TauT family transport system ATP-binding protein